MSPASLVGRFLACRHEVHHTQCASPVLLLLLWLLLLLL
jgi:hypothetical protein